jgi:hypothetical protein
MSSQRKHGGAVDPEFASSSALDRYTAQQLHDQLTHAGHLVIWTVYERPRDYPRMFIARPHFIADGASHALPVHLVGETRIELLERLPYGLTRMPRDEADEPHIVETWL